MRDPAAGKRDPDPFHVEVMGGRPEVTRMEEDGVPFDKTEERVGAAAGDQCR